METLDDVYNRLRGALVVDVIQIDTELAQMPFLMMEAAEQCSTAIAARDRAKNDLDFYRANAGRQIRNGEAKLSQAAVAEEVELDEVVQDYTAKLEDAKAEVMRWQGLVDSLRAKSHSLTKYADLLISGYVTRDAAVADHRAKVKEIRDNLPIRQRQKQAIA